MDARLPRAVPPAGADSGARRFELPRVTEQQAPTGQERDHAVDRVEAALRLRAARMSNGPPCED